MENDKANQEEENRAMGRNKSTHDGNSIDAAAAAKRGLNSASNAEREAVTVSTPSLSSGTVVRQINTENGTLRLNCPSNEEFHLPNIDDGDTEPVLEYVEDIFRALREQEKEIPNFINPVYMRQHSDLTPENRANLVDWMIGVQQIFKLEEETLFLCVSVFNIFLSSQQSIEGEWDLRLVAVTAMLIAWKYEEVDLPDVFDFAEYIAADFTVHEIELMEAAMSMIVQHRLAVPTSYLFLKWFLKAAGENTMVKSMACFLSEMCLFSEMMLEYPPSKLAAAALYHARHIFFPEERWTKTLEFYTGYQEEELRECASSIIPSLIEPDIGSLYYNIYQKYSNERAKNLVAKLTNSNVAVTQTF